MIYMEPHQLGWKPLKDSYMDTLPPALTEEHKELVSSRVPSPPPSSSEAAPFPTPGAPGFLAASPLSSPCGGRQ